MRFSHLIRMFTGLTGMIVLLGASFDTAMSETFNIPPRDVDALVSAINTANENGEADTINLAQGSVYTLRKVRTDHVGGAFGLPAIASKITVNGNESTIRRDPFLPCPETEDRNFGIILIKALNESSGKLTLMDAVVSHGCQQEESLGGGIFNSHGTLTVKNSLIQHNQGEAGIVNRGTTRIENSRIRDNFGAISGGGIRNGGTLTLVNSTVTRNKSNWGGGIGNRGTLKVIDSSIVNNQAFSAGGGGLGNAQDARATITDSIISENQVYSFRVGTSGIVNDGHLLLDRVLMTRNTTIPVRNIRSSDVIKNNGQMSIQNSILTQNGSQIPIRNFGNLNIAFSTFFRTGRVLKNMEGTTKLKSSLLAGNGDNCLHEGGSIESMGYNVANDSSCNTNSINDLVKDELDGPGGNRLENDFPYDRMTYYPPSVTDLIPEEDCTSISGDQIETDIRGVTRPQDGNGDQTAHCDAGALEDDQ